MTLYPGRLYALKDSVETLHKTVIIDDLPDISALGEYLLPPTDVTGYATLTLEISEPFVGNISAYEGVSGNDMQPVAMMFGQAEETTTIISGPGLFTIRLRCPLVALKVTSYTSGTPKLIGYLTTAPYAPRTVSTVSSSLAAFDVNRNFSSAGVFVSGGIDVRSRNQLLFYISVSSISGTGASVVASVESSIDGFAPWFPVTRSNGDPISKSLSAVGEHTLGVSEPVGRFVRVKYTVAGTSPNITLSARLVSKG